MMPPYAALYSPRGVYTHPAIPIGPYPHGQGVPSSPATGTPLSMEMPPKSANSNRGLMKKLKGFEGLAMSIGNGHTDSTNLRTENKLSQRFVSLFSFYINFCRFFFIFFLNSYVVGSWRRNQILFNGIKLKFYPSI